MGMTGLELFSWAQLRCTLSFTHMVRNGMLIKRLKGRNSARNEDGTSWFFLQALLFGIFVMTYWVGTSLLFRKDQAGERKKRNWFLLGASSVMFVASSLAFTCLPRPLYVAKVHRPILSAV